MRIATAPAPATEFQFHKGTIRTEEFDEFIDMENTFQFHKGTIRTHGEAETTEGVSLFQFHKGTIRTCKPHFPKGGNGSFNSIKVRLEPPITSP